MLKLYSEKRARAILDRWSPLLHRLAARYPLPEAALRAVLLQEMTGIDLLDPVADALVSFYWRRKALRRRLHAMGLTGREELRLTRGPLGKRDSSVGYAQIFGYVAIRAINFALDRRLTTAEALGLDPAHRLDPKRDADLESIWRRARRDRAFNIELCALNMLAAGEEMTGRLGYGDYSPEELKLSFARYNADTRRVTPYGEQVYRRYAGGGHAAAV